jgi:putative peptidoglycan lipid II flippase
MVPLFGPSGGLDRAEIFRAAAAGIISFAGTSLLLHLIPQRQTYLGDIISLTLGGIVWATLAIATLRLTGSKLLSQILSRIA